MSGEMTTATKDRKVVLRGLNNADVEENGLVKFAELMGEVAELPQEQQEKVCIYIQGFMAAGRMRQAV